MHLVYLWIQELFLLGIDSPRGKPRGIIDWLLIIIVLANPAASSGECARIIQKAEMEEIQASDKITTKYLRKGKFI